jgi:hypothetical protein
MPTINMRDFFDIRITYDPISTKYVIRSLNAQASFVENHEFDSTKTYKLTIRKPSNANILEVEEVSPDPSGNFVDFINPANAFSCYFFQEFVGTAIAGVIGIGDVRPIINKTLRISKLDGNYEAYLKFEFDSSNVLKCKIYDSPNTVDTLSAFANQANQVFYKTL